MQATIDRILTELEAEPPTCIKHYYNFLRYTNPAAAQGVGVANHYLRRLDDTIDSGSDPQRAATLLEEEHERLERCSRPRAQPDEESDRLLLYLRDNHGPRVLGYMQQIVRGMRMDSEIMRTATPLPERELRERHALNGTPIFHIISLIAHGRELRRTPGLDEFSITYNRCDALVDMREDLEAGLVLFPAEQLERHGISLVRGGKVPAAMQALFEEERQAVIGAIRRTAHHISETNLPLLERSAMHAYFRFAKTAKMERAAYEAGGTLYGRQGAAVERSKAHAIGPWQAAFSAR